MIGQSLTHFEITAKLGRGGMGEVYRARDTRLGREVAIKILPEEFTADPERFARFEREAKILASLNHSNIAGIHQIEEAGGTRFLVMELVEGATLAERLSAGPLPVPEALRLALEIAKGLEAAHAKGVIHRDLKPANVMVTAEGQVKILDFGLAKHVIGGGTGGSNMAHAPTLSLTAQLTGAGTVLGTPPYMSPEQLRGKTVDVQSDIWALGVVLCEMLTGERTFAGETVSDTIASILDREPAWDDLPVETPPLVRSLLRRCLQKDPKQRLRDVADARLELEEALSAPVAPSIPAAPAPTDAHSLRRTLNWIAVGVLVAAAVLMLVTLRVVRGGNTATDSPTPAYASIDLLGGTTVFLRENPAVALSPDGQMLVWAADGLDGTTRLYVRDLDEPVARVLDGTESAYGPFFSPDGRWIAYFDQAEAQLEKVSITGGAPKRIAEAPRSSKGATWSERGEIVFSYGWDGGLARVSAEGGTVELLTEPDRAAGVKSHRFPSFLPGGQALLFMSCDEDIATFNESRIEALELDSGERKLLVEGGMNPRFAASGHLVFAREGALLAAPFDPENLTVLAPPTPVFDGVVTNDRWGYGQYAMASGGTLLYAPGGPETYFDRFARADRTGQVEPMPLPEQVYGAPFEFSPDGRQIAITVTGANFDVWIWNWERQILSRLTAGWNNDSPTWSPDGRRIVFVSDRRAPKTEDLHWVPADGSGPSEVLHETHRPTGHPTWSPNGRFLAFEEWDPETDFDIWILPIAGDMTVGAPERLVGTRAREMFPSYSPDGRWLAYSSDETGVQEIYVRPFPGPGPKQQVSSGGGSMAQWGQRRDELVYVDHVSSRLMRVPVRTTPDLWIGRPEALFDFDSPSRFFRIDPDGEHIVFFQRGSQAKPITSLGIIFHWFQELETKAPHPTS